MAIKDTITDSSKFYHFLQSTDGYKNNFSYDGACALQAYLDELSEDIGEPIEFDPIAWCVEYTEYEDINDVMNEYEEIKSMQDLEDNTTVIEFQGGIIIQDF